VDTLKQWKTHFESLNAYQEAVALLYWDMRTHMPEQSAGNRSKSIGFLSTESFRRKTDATYRDLLKRMGEQELEGLERASYMEAHESYVRDSKIPEEEYQEFVTLISEAESVWEKAKNQDDWKMFEPFLEKIVETERRFVEYFTAAGVEQVRAFAPPPPVFRPEEFCGSAGSRWPRSMMRTLAPEFFRA